MSIKLRFLIQEIQHFEFFGSDLRVYSIQELS
jgi:hypothetical protein